MRAASARMTAREMNMESRRSSVRQEVPDALAQQLRALREADSPQLNIVLAAARSLGWSTPALADALDMNPPAVSKRIERARARLVDFRPGHPEILATIDEFGIGKPVKIRATLEGKQLAPEKIAELRHVQQQASRVNGAKPVGHPDRRISEEFSAELNRLIEEEGFSPYYLASVMEISHRAITSRLERHHMREPCPSVAGTASGVYFNRKIGDPGQGAPRLTREQRAELRQLWQAYTANRAGARAPLATALRRYLKRGFTLANLAQTMSTREVRVRYGALQVALSGDRAGAGA